MKKKPFSTDQIVAVLKQTELGLAVSDIIRQLEIFGADPLSLEEAV